MLPDARTGLIPTFFSWFKTIFKDTPLSLENLLCCFCRVKLYNTDFANKSVSIYEEPNSPSLTATSNTTIRADMIES